MGLERVLERKRRIIRQFSLYGPLSRFGTRNVVSSTTACHRLEAAKLANTVLRFWVWPEAQIQARSVGQFALYNQGKM